MPDDRLTLANLRDRVMLLEAAVRVSTVLPINILDRILDRLVDERKIEASVREDCWALAREEIRTAAIGSEMVEAAALAAVPRRRRTQNVAAPITPPPPASPERDVLRARPKGDGDGG